MSYRIEESGKTRYGCAACFSNGITKSYACLQGLHTHRLKEHRALIEAKKPTLTPDRRHYIDMFKAGCNLMIKPVIIQNFDDVKTLIKLGDEDYQIGTFTNECKYGTWDFLGDAILNITITPIDTIPDRIVVVHGAIENELSQNESGDFVWKGVYCKNWIHLLTSRFKAIHNGKTLTDAIGKYTVTYVKFTNNEKWRAFALLLRTALIVKWQETMFLVKHGFIQPYGEIDITNKQYWQICTIKPTNKTEEYPGLLDITIEGHDCAVVAEELVQKFGAMWNGIIFHSYPGIVQCRVMENVIENIKKHVEENGKSRIVNIKQAKFPVPMTEADKEEAAIKILDLYNELVSYYGETYVSIEEPEESEFSNVLFESP